MKQTINLFQFHEDFRSLRPDNFSYDGLSLLFDYFEQLEDDIGEQIELDVIAICCEWAEDTPEGIAAYYTIDISDLEDASEIEYTVLEYLNDHTQVAGVTDNGFIVYQQF